MCPTPLVHQFIADRLRSRARHFLSGFEILDLDTGLAVAEHHDCAAALRRGNVVRRRLLRVRARAARRQGAARDRGSNHQESYSSGDHCRLVE
jgi:hypothetical protein